MLLKFEWGGVETLNFELGFMILGWGFRVSSSWGVYDFRVEWKP
jgi:hypothetical protein